MEEYISAAPCAPGKNGAASVQLSLGRVASCDFKLLSDEPFELEANLFLSPEETEEKKRPASKTGRGMRERSKLNRNYAAYQSF